MGLSLNLLLAY